VGRDDYNLNLSSERARSVAQYLISRGVNGGRISASGMGKNASLWRTTPPRTAVLRTVVWKSASTRQHLSDRILMLKNPTNVGFFYAWKLLVLARLKQGPQEAWQQLPCLASRVSSWIELYNFEGA
jgi:hypothetical protein